MTQVTDSPIANLVPSTPRPVTRRAALRSWAEPSVQKWWKSAILVALVTAYVTAYHMRDHLARKWMLDHGLPVQAQIVYLNFRHLEGGVGVGSYQAKREGDVPVTLKQVNGTLPSGQPFEYNGLLPKGPGVVHLGEIMELRVDPNDYTKWIEVGRHQSFVEEFTATFLLLPMVVLLLAYAYWQRMKVLKVWRHGKLAEAVVVACRHSAMSPRSQVCRFTLADGDDRRVFHTLYPTRRGMPEPGNVLDLVMLPSQPGRAIVADFYVREVTV